MLTPIEIISIITGVFVPLASFTTYRYKKMGKVLKTNQEEYNSIISTVSFVKNAQREKEQEESTLSNTQHHLQRAIDYNTTEVPASEFAKVDERIEALNKEIQPLQNKLRQAKKDAQPILEEMQRQREIREAKEREERARQEAIEAEARRKREEKRRKEEEEERQARRRRDEEDSRRRSSSSYYDSSSSSSSSSSWSGGGGDSSGGGSSDSW